MKQSSVLKRAALVLMLLLAMVLLCSCYTEPDRIIDNPGVTAGQATFESVITPTPTATPYVTPAPTTNEVDWSSWNFGNDTATNPPSVITITAAPGETTPVQPGVTPVPGTSVTATPGSSTASPVPATPTPTPTSSVLKEGSKGTEVKKLQQRLKDLGYYKGSVDGTFGSGTAAAVKAFQSRNGLTADGKAGNATLTKLYSSSAKKAAVATATPKKTTAKTTPKPTSTNKYTSGKTNLYLESGGSGANVKYMQNRLIELGYLSGTANGKFDESTEAAVIAFQKRNGLWADGVAGPSTLSLMYSSSAKKASSVAATLGSLRPGSEGSAVRTLQKNLKTLGYYSGSVDGSYGEGTTAAVRSFQSSHGLTADGIAGQATLNKIASALNGGSSSGGSGSGSSSSNKTDPTVYGKTASSNGYTTISSGTSAKRVKELQAALQATGFYTGTVNGEYNSKTTAAVKSFQKSKGLRVTGIAGPCTLRLLYGNKAETGSYTKLSPGDTGAKVKQLQYALYELKYYDGKITGSYDNATENAVMEFQQRNGLEVDGIAGVATQRRLFSSNVSTNGLN